AAGAGTVVDALGGPVARRAPVRARPLGRRPARLGHAPRRRALWRRRMRRTRIVRGPRAGGGAVGPGPLLERRRRHRRAVPGGGGAPRREPRRPPPGAL